MKKARIAEVRKHIEISFLLNAPLSTSISFERNITLDFIPDEMIVRQISYRVITTETDVYIINSDLVNGDLGTFFIFPNFLFNETIFPIKKPIIGLYTFSIRKQPSSAITGVGNLSLHLEFIKYR